jgi:hypothetical protein
MMTLLRWLAVPLLLLVPQVAWACGDDGSAGFRIRFEEFMIAAVGAGIVATAVLMPWFLLGVAPGCPTCGGRPPARWRDGRFTCDGCGAPRTVHARRAYFLSLVLGVIVAVGVTTWCTARCILGDDDQFIFVTWGLGGITSLIIAWLIEVLRTSTTSLPRAVQVNFDGRRDDRDASL